MKLVYRSAFNYFTRKVSFNVYLNLKPKSQSNKTNVSKFSYFASSTPVLATFSYEAPNSYAIIAYEEPYQELFIFDEKFNVKSFFSFGSDERGRLCRARGVCTLCDDMFYKLFMIYCRELFQ